MIKSLNIFSTDPDSLLSQYESGFGFEIAEKNKSYFTIKFGATEVKFSRRQLGKNSLYKIKLSSPPVGIAALKNRLTAAGTAFETDGRFIIFRDLAGNRLEVISDDTDLVGLMNDFIEVKQLEIISNDPEKHRNELSEKIGDCVFGYIKISESSYELTPDNTPFSATILKENSKINIIYSGRGLAVMNLGAKVLQADRQ